MINIFKKSKDKKLEERQTYLNHFEEGDIIAGVGINGYEVTDKCMYKGKVIKTLPQTYGMIVKVISHYDELEEGFHFIVDNDLLKFVLIEKGDSIENIQS